MHVLARHAKPTSTNVALHIVKRSRSGKTGKRRFTKADEAATLRQRLEAVVDPKSVHSPKRTFGITLNAWEKSGIPEEYTSAFGFSKALGKHLLAAFKKKAYQLTVGSGKMIGGTVLKESFEEFLNTNAKSTQVAQFTRLQQCVDVSNPKSWYPDAARIKRKFILHIGPTNSGKTYNALKRLREAGRGIYCGPLRLLAHEVYETLRSEGYSCNLKTGEEFKGDPSAAITSCTIEMASFQEDFDVAIVDEAQMMADSQRGWAWTQALIGLRAREIHVCGDGSFVDVARRILSDDVEIKNYSRLGSLQVEEGPCRSLGNLRRGDCVVSFSRADVFRWKATIEDKTHHSCSAVYGSLPPETRLMQAQLFNEGQNEVLSATDAIGMGLNLKIRRVIFSTLSKYDGIRIRPLTPTAMKQIAGRAGRYGHESEGLVTSFTARDYGLFSSIYRKKLPTLQRAGLQPTAPIIEKLSDEFPELKLSDLLAKFELFAKTDTQNFFICNVKQLQENAKAIEDIPMMVSDKYVFVLAPANTRVPTVKMGLVQMARSFSDSRPFDLMAFFHANPRTAQVVRSLSVPSAVPRQDVEVLEDIYKTITLYRWLGTRFSSHPMFDVDFTKGQCEALARDVCLRINLGLATKVKEEYEAEGAAVVEMSEEEMFDDKTVAQAITSSTPSATETTTKGNLDDSSLKRASSGGAQMGARA